MLSKSKFRTFSWKNVHLILRKTVATFIMITAFMWSGDVFAQTASNGNCGIDAPTATSGDCNFAAGSGSAVTGDGATALSGGTASGDASFAAGSGATATGNSSVALAGGNASGVFSVSIGSNSGASGVKSFSIGQSSVSGDYGYSMGKENVVGGECTWTFGEFLRTGSSATHNMVIGHGIFNSSALLQNDISNSIMIGANSDVPTIFIGNSGGISGSYGNVGIGNITNNAASLLHVRNQIRLGYASSDNGSVVFNNDANANTVTINSGVTTASYGLILPTATGSDGDLLELTTGGQLEWISPSAITGAWLIEGNAGTNENNNFLGTTDNKDLSFRTNSVEEMRILSGGNVGIGTSAPIGTLHLDDNGGDTDLIIERSGSSEANLRFNVGSNQRARIGLESSSVDLYYDHLLTGRDHIFRIVNSTYGSDYEIMRIEGSTANVGIGENDPKAKLHVMAEPDESGSAIIARFGIQDIGTPMFLQIANQEASSTLFAPIIQGTTNTTTKPGFMFRGMIDDETLDTLNQPVVLFQVRRNTSNDNVRVKTRPLFQFSNNTVTVMTITPHNNGNSANVGIGTTTPAYKLSVNGDACKSGGGTWVACSDENLKQDVEDFNDGLELLLQFEPKWFNYNGTYGLSNKQRYVGVIAQEVRDITPYMIDTVTLTDSLLGANDFLTYDASALTYVIVNSIQELEHRLVNQDSLVQRLMSLSGQVRHLQDLVLSCCQSSNAKMSEEILQMDEKANKNLGEFILLKADPNPFIDKVKISFEIPAKSKRVQLFVTDIKGDLIRKFEIVERGTGHIVLYGSSIDAGTYVCSLVIDGEVKQTKKIIKVSN